MKFKKLFFALLAVVVLSGGAWAGWQAWRENTADRLPVGIVSANGRLEAAQIDVATEMAGRVVEISASEGDKVQAGDIVARLDAEVVKAELARAEAEAERARQGLAAAQAALAAQDAELTFARQEFDRTAALADRGVAAHQAHQLSQQRLASAEAGRESGLAQIAQAEAAIRVAEAVVEQAQVMKNQAEIVAPVSGTVLYQLVEAGAVLPAGGRILTLLDMSDVTMTVFLSARDAGRLVVGSEARVILDAAPETVVPVTVSFVSPEAQFTPKTVETEDERARLMFRVELAVPPAVLEQLEGRVVSGLRGLAYLRTDPAAGWPDWLAASLPTE